MKILLFILTFNQIIEQTKIISQDKTAFNQAIIMERSGEVSDAKLIYKKILEQNPSHQKSYLQLRNIYTQEGNYGAGIVLVKNWLIYNPDDLQSELMLGEFYFRNQQKSEALETWENFSKTKLSNKTTFRLLFHTYARFGQVELMETLTSEARKTFNEPYLFAIDLANYFQSRQTYIRSLNEYMTLIEYQKQYLQYTTDRILMMSDDESTHSIIDSILNNHTNINLDVRYILAGFYYKTGKFSDALNQHKLIGISNSKAIKRWMGFAHNLRKEGNYNLSIEAYHYLLQNLDNSDPSTIGEALLGLGEAYENQILQNQTELKFVNWFPENQFFIKTTIKSPDIAPDFLINTIEHYQSILALLPPSNTTATAHYRLGEIQAKIIHDFQGSLISYKSALESKQNKQLSKKINIKIGELYLLNGKFELATEYFKPKNQKNADKASIHYINSLLYNENIDESLTYLDSVILNLSPQHLFFNDLLEMHDLLINFYNDGTRDDKIAFKKFFHSEGLIKQHKIPEAILSLEKINNDYSDALITPLSNLRLAILLVEFEQYDKALKTIQSIENSSLKDQALALAGEIEERFLGNNNNALKYYYRLLSECESSLLVEPIRLHIRKLSKPNES